MLIWKLIWLLLSVCHLCNAFSDYLLKKCDQSGFCQRNRHYASQIDSSKSYYAIDEGTLHWNDTVLSATIIKTVKGNPIARLPFTLTYFQNLDSLRFTIDEIREIDESSFIIDTNRYNETWKWSFEKLPQSDTLTVKKIKSNAFSWFKTVQNIITIENSNNDLKIELSMDSFHLDIYHNSEKVISVNEKSLLNIEHYRTPELNEENVNVEESIFNMFHDNFQYSRDDSMPLGPESVGLDFKLYNFNSVYGIPEHADSLRLKDTRNSDPYRLFNVDVFEYNINSTMPTYGSIPLMISTNTRNESIGLFWNNAADTWIDIKYEDKDTLTHWYSENGIIDVVLLFGSKPTDIISQYVELTGKPALPLISSIGYHQCRWNYNDELDVLNVENGLDSMGIPFDFIWLDLEYTDDKKFFTWKLDSFGNPLRLLKKLNQLGRNLVVLIDPHLKDNYFVSDLLKTKSVEVKNYLNQTFVGHCWPGDSIWIDTLSQFGQSVWFELFKNFTSSFVSNNLFNLHFWNDMNEPSIFNGPETTAPKDLIHDGREERSIHNLYGLTVHEATYASIKELYHSMKRPFILTRSFFAGSQRTAATWTGDNVASWDYLKVSIPMVLTNNIAGMPFIGADVAGFVGNPSNELIIRWYQAGIWYPFFRAHAHIDSMRREPYLLDNSTRNIVRETIQLRYSLLPTFYTAFYESSSSGSPIAKPMVFQYNNYEEFYDIDDQFYIGDFGLLIKPITDEGATTTTIYFPPGIFYDLKSMKSFQVEEHAQRIEVPAPVEKVPAFIEGGHIITKRERSRRSTKPMTNDPYTLVIAPGLANNAQGKLYVDDGESFDYQNGESIETIFTLSNGEVLTNNVVHGHSLRSETLGNLKIEKIIIGLTQQNGDLLKDFVNINSNGEEYQIPVHKNAEGTMAFIKDPLVSIDENWEISFN
ncbi:hypothetical protein KAFR_0G02180 [Kazachstania africana CBS 2517]|uniref:Glucosidase II subunit alpha n=1 Tax=Kazachstania africana (strain ATCC 22294 / BCRC 22015 / CBS 2517 / CECT 1963 / NBRC 1671 / NRRL Y-8276) TaxID=1071382 RepID=H2AY02_KAZAF|nr:hypothetical protein KAFR_0G02180 [Kazachstania africana CBS 2517]CCF59252.1 hypothetical protein KAFR_0G02180 [Kazachstania africana CBS 2517]